MFYLVLTVKPVLSIAALMASKFVLLLSYLNCHTSIAGGIGFENAIHTGGGILDGRLASCAGHALNIQRNGLDLAFLHVYDVTLVLIGKKRI